MGKHARRLLVFTDDHAESLMINAILRDHLLAAGYAAVHAKLLGHVHSPSAAARWPDARAELVEELLADPEQVVTTMMDYNRLNEFWADDAKGKPNGKASERSRAVCRWLVDDVTRETKLNDPDGRFIPFVLMPEFESLLFSDCDKLAEALGAVNLARALQFTRDKFVTPEDMDGAGKFSPSVRIMQRVPEYQRSLHGIFAAKQIGVASIRERCPLFNQWLAQLENLAAV